MTLAHPSELFPFLRKIDAAPKKGLSQNFLIDPTVIGSIVSAAAIQPNDLVLEIGSGPGALTEALLAAGAHVIAIEKDFRFARSLERLDKDGRLSVYEADVLEFDFTKFASNAPMKIVANLPYHITSPILEKICAHSSLFSSAYVMVQKEVAHRIIAQPRTKNMSSFTIFLRAHATASIAVNVSRRSFFPVPGVDSSVVELKFHETKYEYPETFFAFVRKGFSQRRKMLRSTLQISAEPFQSMRPEELSLSDWVQLYSFFCHKENN